MSGVLNEWGIMISLKCSSFGKVSYCCFWSRLKTCWSSGEYPFWSSHDHRFELLTCEKNLNSDAKLH